ncbi:carboxylate--amine ligase [Streptomyces mirabilis]|uniref:carboxylate--amine ligase n=1 Tax=Streptomyces mirabilis TaxID=68239 RepID=UPI003662C601
MARIDVGGLDTRTGALILKIGRYRLHHGGVAVVRSLGRAGVRVFGAVEDRLTPAALSTYLAGGFVWPTVRASAAESAIADGLAEIACRLERPCVVVPTDDMAAVALDELASSSPAGLLMPPAARGLARRLADKQSCAEIALKAGMPVPEGDVVSCPADTADIAGLPLPAVVKRAEPALLGDGSRTFSTVIARTPAELRRALQDESAGPYVALVQRLFEGDDWLYHGYCDASSRALVSFTGRKLRSRPAGAGETAFAQAEENPALRENVERFLAAIGYAGPVSMDLRYDRDARVYRLLDVNPRIGACFRLFVNTHGIDVVRALHLDLTGREVPYGTQVTGRSYLVEGYDLQVRDAYGRGVSGWLRGVRAADERAWLQSGDLVPAAAAALQRLCGEPKVPSGVANSPAVPRYFTGRAHRPRRYLRRDQRNQETTWTSPS